MKVIKIIGIIFLLNSFLNAEDAQYRFDYFGNITTNALNKDGYTYRNYQMDDIDDDPSWESYSILGAQLSIYKGDFDFIYQGTARSYENGLETETKWLNIKYYMGDFAVRAGRMQLPLFLNSNSLDVDYVHLWAKAPIEVYGIFPSKSYDGVEFLYQKGFDDFYFDLQITPYGKIKEDVSMIKAIGEVEIENDDIRNIAMSLEWNNFTFKSSYTEGKLTIPLDGTGLSTLITYLNNFGYGSLAERYTFNEKKLKFYSFGIDYSDDNFIVNTEIVKSDSDSFLPPMIAYYALAGYRINSFTPYIMYAENKNDKDFYTVDELANSNNTTIEYIKSQLEQQLYTLNSSQKTVSLGFRYDYMKGVAFKMQLDRITTSNYGTPSTSSEYERIGFLARDRGVSDGPVYMGTVSISFAF